MIATPQIRETRRSRRTAPDFHISPLLVFYEVTRRRFVIQQRTPQAQPGSADAPPGFIFAGVNPGKGLMSVRHCGMVYLDYAH